MLFRRDLKFLRDDAFLICTGNLFHKVGAATLNVQLPYDLSWETGTCNSIWLDDLSFRDDFLMDTSSHRYSGAISLIDLYIINKIWKWIRCLTGSQCSFWRFGVIWSYFRVFVTTRIKLILVWCLPNDSSVFPMPQVWPVGLQNKPVICMSVYSIQYFIFLVGLQCYINMMQFQFNSIYFIQIHHTIQLQHFPETSILFKRRMREA